jgi:hypothetical protein
LQWAHQNGCEWDGFTWGCADPSCHPYLIEHGCPGTENACEWAASEGRLELLQWARQNGCPWNEDTCEYAARGGHLEVLQWAHENGCPWDEWTWASSDPSCHPYLIEHGCPGADDADDADDE